MRKIIVFLLCVLLVSAAVVSVSAAETATMTITPSKSAANPGDEIAFTVSVSALDACTAAGIILDYDSAVYEMGSWECLVSGAMMPSYDAKTKLLSFANLGNPLSGDIFRFTLKIKSTADLGSANVSGTPYLRNSDGTPEVIEAEVKSASVTVTCKHSYDNSCDATCNFCGETRKITHTWDSGKVTKDPTCTDKGTKTFTCTVCGETKKEDVKATGHKYSNDCDASCNSCGAERSITHDYSTKWSSNSEKHWHECNICGAKKDEQKHTPGAAATEKNPQTCTECGYVLKAALGHTHKYSDTWSKDVIGHWHECTGCDEIKDYQNHVYESDCDTTCDTCGHIRAAEHMYENQWTSDNDGHWHECSVCGDQLEKEPHVPGPEATLEDPQICIVCGFVLTPPEGHTHDYTWKSDAESHWQQCSCGHKLEEAEHIWDQGKVTQEPDVNQTGIKTYTCTVCGAEHEEEIPAKEAPMGTEPTDDPQEPDQQGKVSLPGWLLLAAGAGVTALCALFLVIGIMIGRKQAERYLD